MKFKKIIYIFGIIVFAFTFFYKKSEAATVLLNIPQKNIWVGDEFSVILILLNVNETEGKSPKLVILSVADVDVLVDAFTADDKLTIAVSVSS